MSEKGYVYKFFDDEGNLLYIGKTKDIDRRMKEHNSNGHLSSEQYEKVCTIRYVETSSMNDAGILERYLIAKEKPKFNVQYSNEGDCEIKVSVPQLWKTYSSKLSSVKCADYFFYDLNTEKFKCNIPILISTSEDAFLFDGRTFIKHYPIFDVSYEEAGEYYEAILKTGGNALFGRYESIKRCVNSKNVFSAFVLDGDCFFNGEFVGKINALKNVNDSREDLNIIIKNIPILIGMIRFRKKAVKK